MDFSKNKTKPEYKIISIDKADIIGPIFTGLNKSVKSIANYESKNHKYKAIFYTSTKQLKAGYAGTIEKDGKHWSRLYESQLKRDNSLEGFVGTDLHSVKQETVFFNFYYCSDKGDYLEIKKKIKGGQEGGQV